MSSSPSTVLAGSEHPLPHGSKASRQTNPNQWVELTLGVRRKKDLPDLKALESKQPKQRTYMTRDKLSSEYGSAADSVTRIEAFAQAHQLVVTRDERASARLGLAGTVANLSAAFGVTLFDYTNAQLGNFHARTGPVHVPQDLAGDITGVFGFNNHRILHRKFQKMVKAADVTAHASKTRPWFIPTELVPLYNFPPAGPNIANQCVGLLEFGGGVSDSDLTAYFTTIKTPKPAVTIIALDGVSTDPTADPDSTGEVMLDVDVVGAMSGGAKVAVYFSTFDEKGLIDALSAVINDSTNDPSVVSISWGWAENQPFNQQAITWSPAAIDHINHSFLATAQLGITVCVSTGDDGSEAQIEDGKAHVNFPASSPYVLAVGGTTLHARSSHKGSQKITETVWNDGAGSGTGGGVSDYIAAPAYQTGIVPASINPGGFAGRAIPDVSANADPNTGYLTQSNGKLGIVGGTSASAPLWASLVARINSNLSARAGNFNALLYSKIGPAKTLRDITVGNNDTDGLLGGKFAAGPGWDACTGWGVPEGQQLQDALK